MSIFLYSSGRVIFWMIFRFLSVINNLYGATEDKIKLSSALSLMDTCQFLSFCGLATSEEISLNCSSCAESKNEHAINTIKQRKILVFIIDVFKLGNGRLFNSGCKGTTKIAHTQIFGCFSLNKMKFYVLKGHIGHLCLHKMSYGHIIRKPLGLTKNTHLCVRPAGRERTFGAERPSAFGRSGFRLGWLLYCQGACRKLLVIIVPLAKKYYKNILASEIRKFFCIFLI